MKRYFLGIFVGEDDLLAASTAARAQGLRIVDVFTPYAVHGLDEAMGLRPSRLSGVCLGFGIIGVALAFLMQYWTSAVDWPINVGGRPWNSWPAFVPVAFEVMVLLASFGVVFAFLGVARLYPGRTSWLPAAGGTCDRFVLVLEEADAAFDASRVRALFGRFHAVETIERETSLYSRALSSPSGMSTSAASGSWLKSNRLNIALAIALAAVVIANLMLGSNADQPNMEFLPDMAHSVSYQSYSANPNFPDGRTLQASVDGTIPRGHLPLHFGPSPEEALRAGRELKNPLKDDDQRTKALGPVLYSHHCQVCHGSEGKGDGPVTLRGVPPPPSLLAPKAIDMPDGQIFHVLTYGQGNMASYASHLAEEERWFVIGHIRALPEASEGKVNMANVSVAAPGHSRSVLVVLTILAALALAIGAFLEPTRAWASVLVISFIAVGLGLTGILLPAMFCVIGATWAGPLRRPLHAMTALLPLGAAGLLLVLLLFPDLYPWIEPAPGLGHHASAWQHIWLSRPFFLGRAVAYLACWLGCAFILRLAPRSQVLNGLFLVVFAFTWWLASCDWIMSLEPSWASTMFGLYSFASLFLSGLAAITLLVILNQNHHPSSAKDSANRLHDLGKLLFAFSTFWMYIWYCQYMLIWFVNIPEETSYYVRRLQGGWQPLLVVNVILNWVVPFLVLLSQTNKRSASILVKVSLLILLGRCLDVYLMVMPAVEAFGAGPTALDFALWTGVACCVGVMLTTARHRAVTQTVATV